MGMVWTGSTAVPAVSSRPTPSQLRSDGATAVGWTPTTGFTPGMSGPFLQLVGVGRLHGLDCLDCTRRGRIPRLRLFLHRHERGDAGPAPVVGERGRRGRPPRRKRDGVG